MHKSDIGVLMCIRVWPRNVCMCVILMFLVVLVYFTEGSCVFKVIKMKLNCFRGEEGYKGV